MGPYSTLLNFQTSRKQSIYLMLGSDTEIWSFREGGWIASKYEKYIARIKIYQGFLEEKGERRKFFLIDWELLSQISPDPPSTRF